MTLSSLSLISKFGHNEPHFSARKPSGKKNKPLGGKTAPSQVVVPTTSAPTATSLADTIRILRNPPLSESLPALSPITRKEQPPRTGFKIRPLSGLNVVVPIPEHEKAAFCQGTAEESSLFRNPPQLSAFAKLLLDRHPVGSPDVQLRVHAANDNRGTAGLITVLTDHHIRDKRPDIPKELTDRNKATITTAVQDVVRQMGKQFRITNIEINPSLVQRAEDGAYQIYNRDIDNIRALPPSIMDRLQVTANVQRPAPNAPQFMFPSSPFRWAMGEIKQGDAFLDAQTMPRGQAGVVCSNLLGYLITRDPQRVEKYLADVRGKMLDNAPLLLGEVDTTHPNPQFADPLKTLLSKTGFAPIPHELIPYIKGNKHHAAGPIAFYAKT